MRGLLVSVLVPVVLIFNVDASSYMDLFSKSETFQKDSAFVSVIIHSARPRGKVKSIINELVNHLKADSWKSVSGETYEKYPVIIKVFCGVDYTKYKKGEMKRGKSIVVLVKGKDYMVATDSQGSTTTLVEKIMAHIKKGL